MTRKPERDNRTFASVGDLLPVLSEHLAPIIQEAEQHKALTKQGRHHYNRYKQLEALLQIGEEQNPDMGFMTRLLTLCSLPLPGLANRPVAEFR